jgi:succinate-semialdehyde dehydrogenase/glutarate-semialdehyde dehydrogenase
MTLLNALVTTSGAPPYPHSDLLIGGKRVPGGTGARTDVVNPSDATVIATVADADADADDAHAAVDAAAEALPGWAATPPRERAEILRRCFAVMIERADELAHLISLENGKAQADARAEVAYAAEFFRWYSEEAVRIIGEVSTAPSGANRILVQRRPIGVCVLVTPWNFPAAMATRKIAPALAAGCTTVLKPAPQTPLTAFAVAALLEEAGVPAGVVNLLTTSDAGPVVSAMLHDPRVRKLSFTGSTAVGRTLLREAAGQVLACSMELGGNAPFLVFDDADLPSALDGVMLAKMRNGGQAPARPRTASSCSAASRPTSWPGSPSGWPHRQSGRGRIRRRTAGRSSTPRASRRLPAWSTTPSPAARAGSWAGPPPPATASTTRRPCSPTCRAMRTS